MHEVKSRVVTITQLLSTKGHGEPSFYEQKKEQKVAKKAAMTTRRAETRRRAT